VNKPLFFVVRHGRTAGNKDNFYRGWSNAPFAQLNSDGRDDAREAGIFLKKLGIKFPMIISDNLERCQETRRILASILAIRSEEEDRRLRPIDVGEFAGKSKTDNPLTEYMKDKSKKIPGGESINSFNQRQAKFFADLMEVLDKIKNPIVLVGHGSTVSFLHNHYNKDEIDIGYEGLCDPGGVLMFTCEGITPLTKIRHEAPFPEKDGTPLSGFVTDEQNRPPRECWNCRNYVKDISGMGACTHPLVTIDPLLKDRKQADGTVAVGELDCCDNFRNKIST